MSHLSTVAPTSKPGSCGDGVSCCSCRGPKGIFLAALVVWAMQIPFLLIAVPSFVNRATDFGVALPKLTVAVIDTSAFVAGRSSAGIIGPVVTGIALAVILALAAALSRFGGKAGRTLTLLIALVGAALLAAEILSIVLPSFEMTRALPAPQSAPAAAP